MIRPTSAHLSPDPKANQLLAKLDLEDYQAIIGKSKIVSLKLGKRLYHQDETITAVYFPITCMVSLLVSTSGKQPRLELSTVGKEGVVGAIEVLHSQGALGVCLIQISGTALRISASDFLEQMNNRTRGTKLFGLHLHALTRQILQAAACNHLHSMEERCARWILTSHDHAGQETFSLTQEFLSHMLGVRRATVNQAIGALKKTSLISFVRGKMTVRNRKGLEAASCGCYDEIRRVRASVMKAI